MANPGSLASMMFEIEESEDSLSKSEFQGGGFEETIDTPMTFHQPVLPSQRLHHPQVIQFQNIVNGAMPRRNICWIYCVSALSSRGGNLFEPKIGKQCEYGWLSTFYWRPVVKGCI